MNTKPYYTLEVVRVISEHKKFKGVNRGDGKPNTPVKPGHKRVMALCAWGPNTFTRHIDVPK